MDADDREAAKLLSGAASDKRAKLVSRIEEQMPGQDLRLDLCDIPAEAWHAHYSKVANPFLWFMQHQLYTLAYEPIIDEDLIDAWQHGYRVVNEAFARAAIEQTSGYRRPVVLLQDYHLYLAAATIRAQRPDSLLLHFNHIPWPSVDSWLVLPQALRRVICEGLLANDIVGLQTDRYATNFLASVEAFVRDARVDPSGRHVRWRGRTIWVRAYPISIDPDALTAFARGPEVARHRRELTERLDRVGKPRLIVRVDRLEPSKNVLRGFLAFEALLKRRPELRKSVRFLAIQSISRESVPEYARYAAEVREVVARVNGMADPDQAPIWLLDGSEYALAIAALSLADVVLVNPGRRRHEPGRQGGRDRFACRPGAVRNSGRGRATRSGFIDGQRRGRSRHWRDARAGPGDVSGRAGAALAPPARLGAQRGPRVVADASVARPRRGLARRPPTVTTTARHSQRVRTPTPRLNDSANSCDVSRKFDEVWYFRLILAQLAELLPERILPCASRRPRPSSSICCGTPTSIRSCRR